MRQFAALLCCFAMCVSGWAADGERPQATISEALLRLADLTGLACFADAGPPGGYAAIYGEEVGDEKALEALIRSTGEWELVARPGYYICHPKKWYASGGLPWRSGGLGVDSWVLKEWKPGDSLPKEWRIEELSVVRGERGLKVTCRAVGMPLPILLWELSQVAGRVFECERPLTAYRATVVCQDTPLPQFLRCLARAFHAHWRKQGEAQVLYLTPLNAARVVEAQLQHVREQYSEELHWRGQKAREDPWFAALWDMRQGLLQWLPQDYWAALGNRETLTIWQEEWPSAVARRHGMWLGLLQDVYTEYEMGEGIPIPQRWAVSLRIDSLGLLQMELVGYMWREGRGWEYVFSAPM